MASIQPADLRDASFARIGSFRGASGHWSARRAILTWAVVSAAIWAAIILAVSQI
ncbi:MAG TPA: hypothetical protein VEU47_15000 [Candidatus Cybelea sp.]|nr:hypothetical protein [Candidatus Cybelea sp.]